MSIETLDMETTEEKVSPLNQKEPEEDAQPTETSYIEGDTTTTNSIEETPEITKEQIDENIKPVVEETNRVAQEKNLNQSLEKDQFSQAVYEKKDTPQAIQKLHELGMFKNSNNWKEINGELKQVSKDVTRELLLLQLVGGVGAVAILEPSPLGEIAFGVTVAIAGKHSKVIQKFFKQEDIDKLSQGGINSGVKMAMSK